jgi:hypothetical protein
MWNQALRACSIVDATTDPIRWSGRACADRDGAADAPGTEDVEGLRDQRIHAHIVAGAECVSDLRLDTVIMQESIRESLMSARPTPMLPAAPGSQRATAVAHPRTMTAAEFDALSGNEARFLEIFDGVVREKMAPVFRHSALSANIGAVLLMWGSSTATGRSYPELHCALSETPPIRVVPDVVFL